MINLVDNGKNWSKQRSYHMNACCSIWVVFTVRHRTGIETHRYTHVAPIQHGIPVVESFFFFFMCWQLTQNEIGETRGLYL